MESLSLSLFAEAAPIESVDPRPLIRARRVSAEPGKVTVESVDVATLGRYQAAWSDLTTRTLEPNVFFSPGFALPLLQHVAQRNRVSILLVWEDGGTALFDRLVGLFPLQLPRVPAPGSLARVFTHEQIACGTPLVDRELAPAVFAAVTTWLDTHGGRSAALVLSGVKRDGAFAVALRRFCTETSRSVEVLDAWKRAVLPRLEGGKVDIATLASAKHRKERARQARRLSESGLRTYTSARTPAEIAAATESFLALEDKGWKGARGTSLLADPRRATFARTMTRLMAAGGRCRIDAIEIDGRPVAMGIVLRDGDRAFFWKTTYDDAFASLSPGVQLVTELSRVQQADPNVSVTDSCAIANHPMIDRLWRDREAAVDLMIAVRPGRSASFETCLTWERWRRAMRQRAKRAWHAARHLLQQLKSRQPIPMSA